MEQQPFYKKYLSSSESCPNANTIHEIAFYFGNNPDLTKEELSVLSSLLI
jgi:hypothetical protein